MQWRKSMQLIDANVILRYLLNDNQEMAQKARSLIASGKVYTKPEVISEVVYVLKKVYHIERCKIQTAIYCLFRDISCVEQECVLCAIDIYASISLDFVDCLLIAYHKINSEQVFTFDKKLDKYLNKE